MLSSLHYIHMIFSNLNNKNQFIFINNIKIKNPTDLIFIKFLVKYNFLYLTKWPSGLITNYYQFVKSSKHINTYNKLYNINLGNIKYIFLINNPENKSLIAELLLLKQYLNIKIILFNNEFNVKKDIFSLIDYNINVNNTFSFYFNLVKVLKKYNSN